MKWKIFTCALLLLTTGTVEAQFSLRIRSGPFGGSIGFGFNNGRIAVGGVYSRGYGSFSSFAAPYPVFVGPPVGVIQRNTVTQIITPTVVVPVPEPEPVYDLRGVDLDLQRPPRTIGPNGLRDPEIPGKDVSVPKQPQRPGGPVNEPEPPKNNDNNNNNPPQKPRIPGQQPMPPQPPQPLPLPRDEAKRQIILGKAAFQSEEYGLALQRFRVAAEADVTFAESRFWLAQAYFALCQYDDAVSAIEKGMQIDPNWPNYEFRPRLDLYKGNEPQFSANLKHLFELQKEAPKSVNLLFLKAHQLWFDNRRLEALEHFRQVRPMVANTIYVDRFLQAALPGGVVQN